MSSPKTIGADALISAIHRPDTKIIMWHGKALTVKYMLSFEETTEFVRGVTDVCLDENTGAVIPEMVDFAIRAYTVAMYSFAELPDEVGKQYDVLFGTDIFKSITENINNDQYSAIVNSVKIALRI